MPSEPFIPDQALALRRFEPVFIARDPIVNRRAGARSATLSEFGRSAVRRYALTAKNGDLVRLVAGFQPALIHAHFGVEGVYALHTAKALGIPLITTLHGFDVTMSRASLIKSRKVAWLNYVFRLRALVQHGAAFIAVSQHISQRAVEFGFPSSRIHVVPIGIDTDAIKPGLPSDRPTVLHIARLVEKKGTADLLHAFSRVLRGCPEAQLTIVGDGPLKSQLRRRADDLGIAGSVRFAGALPHDKTLEMLKEATLLCTPSRTSATGDQEGLPMVILEAAAAGKPVIATRHGGIPEAVVDGRTGFMVGEGDVTALAERLTEVLTDAALSASMGREARSRVVKHFNLAAQTAKLENIYETA
jgi:glycosyltransferase involved in cell wall biosynthesis